MKLRTWRDNIWMQIQGADVFKRVDEPGVQIEVNSTVAGWDDHTLFDQRIRNYTKKPIDVEIRRTFPGHIVFRSSPGCEELRLPDGRVPCDGEADGEGQPALRSAPAPRPERQAEQRHGGTNTGQAMRKRTMLHRPYRRLAAAIAVVTACFALLGIGPSKGRPRPMRRSRLIPREKPYCHSRQRSA